ncbi:uncharacterized protein LOC144905655 [Branchiostoma floridae x Branchiostoma belcheri]
MERLCSMRGRTRLSGGCRHDKVIEIDVPTCKRLGLPCGSRLCRLHYDEAKRTPQCCCPIPPTGSHSGTLIPCPARLLRVFRDMADVTNAPTLPSPAPILPSPAPTLPSPAPILPSSASTLPSPASTLPSPASTLPSPASTLPSSASILPTPASILPCPASTLASPASTLPCPAPILPCPAPILPPAVQQVIRTLTSAGPAIQAWENELLLPLIRRQLAASCDGQTVSCKTGGQPIILRKLTKARKATTDVTPTTVRRRVKEVETARKITSRGDTALQLTKELQRLPREDLQAALKAVKLDKIRIPAASLLSAKTDLSITWHQTREMKRWLVQYGISVESEKESRRITGELLSPHGVVSELMPFTAKDGDCKSATYIGYIGEN